MKRRTQSYALLAFAIFLIGCAQISYAQQNGMPPPGFDPNVRISNECDEPRRLYFEGGSTDTLNSHSTMHIRLKPGTRIYLLDDQGKKRHIHTVSTTEDQEVVVCS